MCFYLLLKILFRSYEKKIYLKLNNAAQLTTKSDEKEMSASSGSNGGQNDQSQITHVLNKDKKYLSEHGQKLFNAINCLLDDSEQLELTQSLFKYQRDHNVFTLVRSCRELFDTSKKKVY
jgi:hypothetical protein